MNTYKKRPPLPPFEVLAHLVATAQPIPTKTVTVFDWDAVWAALERDGQTVLQGSYDDTRLLYAWAHKHKKHKINCQRIATDAYIVRLGADV